MQIQFTDVNGAVGNTIGRTDFDVLPVKNQLISFHETLRGKDGYIPKEMWIGIVVGTVLHTDNSGECFLVVFISKTKNKKGKIVK